MINPTLIRPESHEIDDYAQGIFLINKPRNWSAAELSKDYGIDYFIQVFDRKTKYITPTTFIVQLKGTKNYKKTETHVKYNIKTKYLKYYYTKLSIPAFLVVVDTVNNNYCWLFIQKYIHETLNKENPKWQNQKTVVVNIPFENTFENPEIIENCARNGLSYCNLLINGAPTHEMMRKVSELNRSTYIVNEYEKIFEFETDEAYNLLNENNLEESRNFHTSVYNKTKNDENYILKHIKSIIGLIHLYNIEEEDERNKIFQYIDEGLELSILNDFTPLIHYFNGEKLSKTYYTLQKNLKFPLLINDIIHETKISSNNAKSLKTSLENTLKSLDELYITYYANLMDAIENEELIISIELISILIRMQFQYIETQYNQMNEIKINFYLNEVKQLITLFENLSNIFDENIDYKYDLLQFKFMYYCMDKNEKCYEIIEEYERFAEKNKSKYHESKANELKQIITNYLPNKNSYNSVEELSKNYEKLNEIIENPPSCMSEEYLSAIKQSIKDYNPERVLKNCGNLELYYKKNIYEGFIDLLYPAGNKILFCKYGGCETHKDLDEAYKNFYNKYCKDCKNCKEKDFEWKPDKNYVISEEFKKILTNLK